jgi:hypothetical protein
MPAHNYLGRNFSDQQGPSRGSRGETAVATVWLIFYALAIGVTLMSLLVSSAIELAAR